MAPQTVHSDHRPRKQAIPTNLVQKWRSSPRLPVASRVRRPKTACERCRTSKVRCHGDGQHECDRCTSRGLSCTYVQCDPSPGPTITTGSSDPDGASISEEIQIDSEISPDYAASSFQQMLQTPEDWTNFQHPAGSLEQWHDLDRSAGDASGSLNLSDALTPAPGSAPQQHPSLESLGLFPVITSNTVDNLAWQDQLVSQSCQCRAGLGQLTSNARAALAEWRLDEVFRVTRNIIQECEGIFNCTVCSVNCTDLICIVAVFQEADVCFDRLVEDGTDNSIHISMGSYEIGIEADDQDAPQWRRMLVTQLVRRAHRLLDSISGRGQDMLRMLDPACRLGRVNISYLEAVVGNSRENLQRVMERIEELGTRESDT